jgi:hypothetical protein
MVAILGVDPGGTTGIALLDTEGGVKQNLALAQVNRHASLTLIWALADRCRDQGAEIAVAVERFVSGPRSGKLATPKGATTARLVIGEITAWAEASEVPVYLRSAGEVKPWASDARLDKVVKDRRGMPHAVDALRHALFCAVRDYGMPDPLSRRSGASAGRSMLSEPAVGAPQHPDGGT